MSEGSTSSGCAPRYLAAKRSERSHLLTEMEQVTGMHRKSLTRLLHAVSLERKKRSQPRPRSYGLEVERVVLKVWESLDYICAERLTPSLVSMAKPLARFGILILTPAVEAQPSTISCSTVERMLRKNRFRKQRLPRKGPERANQVTKDVPLGRIPWDTQEPGHFEVEKVASLRRAPQATICIPCSWWMWPVGGASGWRSWVGDNGRWKAAFDGCWSVYPSKSRERHPDNGSKFFNQHAGRASGRRKWSE